MLPDFCKRKHFLIGIIMVLVLVVSLAVSLLYVWQQSLVTMKFDGSDPPRLIWGNRVYDCYGNANGNLPAGKQIGIIGGHNGSRVFEAPGKAEQDWLVVTESDEMTIYTLYKRESDSRIA